MSRMLSISVEIGDDDGDGDGELAIHPAWTGGHFGFSR